MDRLLLRLAEQRPAVRIALAVTAALLVYGLGRLVAVGPLQDRADGVRAEADRTARQLRVERRRLEGFEPAPDSLTAAADSLRARLRRASGDVPGGLRSGLLTVLSSTAEEAGAGSPLFNRRGSPSDGGVLGDLRVLTVEGDLQAGTRSVATFLERLGGLPVPVIVDSLDLDRQVPENRAFLRLRILAPEREG